MIPSAGSETNAPRDESGDLLCRVRQVDPTSDEAAVRRYAREIAEADAVLDTVDIDDVPLLVPFSAAWPQGPAR